MFNKFTSHRLKYLISRVSWLIDGRNPLCAFPCNVIACMFPQKSWDGDRFPRVSIPAAIYTWPHAGSVPDHFRDRQHLWKGLKTNEHWEKTLLLLICCFRLNACTLIKIKHFKWKMSNEHLVIQSRYKRSLTGTTCIKYKRILFQLPEIKYCLNFTWGHAGIKQANM